MSFIFSRLYLFIIDYISSEMLLDDVPALLMVMVVIVSGACSGPMVRE